MLSGPPLYEWLSHNAFVIAAIVGVIAVTGYFAYNSSRRKGRYRQ
ncbi:EYxxD motif small membrane protein [Brevibacillus sp. GCM10020057]